MIAASLIFLTVYIVNDGHNLEIHNKVVDDIYSAVISIILGALVTMTLLYAQTMNEDSRTKNSEIFREKIRLYRDFLESLGEFTKDGRLDKEEIMLLLLKHSLINMVINEANQKLLNNAISKINEDLFFENENNVPDYKALGEVFNEIANIFKADLYGEKLSKLIPIEYENFFEISNFVRTKTIYKESIDEFMREIIPGRVIFFSIKGKGKDSRDKSYKFKIQSDAPDHYRFAYDFVLNVMKEFNFMFEIKYEIAFKKLYQSIAINNPKILILYKEKVIMRIGITNRNRVALQLLKDDEKVGTYPLDPLDDSKINTSNIRDYIPIADLRKHISLCVKEYDL